MAATWNYWGSSSPSSGNHPFCFKISETKICIYIYTHNLILFIYIYIYHMFIASLKRGFPWCPMGRTIISKVRLVPWIWRLGGKDVGRCILFEVSDFQTNPMFFGPTKHATMAHHSSARRKDLKMRSVMEHSLRIRWDTVSTSLGKLGKLGVFPPPPKKGAQGSQHFLPKTRKKSQRKRRMRTGTKKNCKTHRPQLLGFQLKIWNMYQQKSPPPFKKGTLMSYLWGFYPQVTCGRSPNHRFAVW